MKYALIDIELIDEEIKVCGSMITDNEKDYVNSILQSKIILLNHLKSKLIPLQPMLDDASHLVNDLAKWSIKYPRNRVYSMSKITMDDELINLEERAKKIYKHMSLDDN